MQPAPPKSFHDPWKKRMLLSLSSRKGYLRKESDWSRSDNKGESAVETPETHRRRHRRLKTTCEKKVKKEKHFLSPDPSRSIVKKEGEEPKKGETVKFRGYRLCWW